MDRPPLSRPTRYDEQAIGIADDLSDADGVTVLNYWQVVDVARGTSARATAAGPYTVADAVLAYIEFLTRERKTAYGIGVRMAAHVLPTLGKVHVADLTADTLRKWHGDLAKQPPRVRTALGRKQQYRRSQTTTESPPPCLGQPMPCPSEGGIELGIQ